MSKSCSVYEKSGYSLGNLMLGLTSSVSKALHQAEWL